MAVARCVDCRSSPLAPARLHLRIREPVIASSDHVIRFRVKADIGGLSRLTDAVGHLRDAIKYTAQALDSYSQALDAPKEVVADAETDGEGCGFIDPEAFDACGAVDPEDFDACGSCDDCTTPAAAVRGGDVDHKRCGGSCCTENGRSRCCG